MMCPVGNQAAHEGLLAQACHAPKRGNEAVAPVIKVSASCRTRYHDASVQSELLVYGLFAHVDITSSNLGGRARPRSVPNQILSCNDTPTRKTLAWC